MPPAQPKPRRRLTTVPEDESQLDRLVRSLEVIALGVKDIAETLDAIIETRDDGGPPSVRVVKS